MAAVDSSSSSPSATPAAGSTLPPPPSSRRLPPPCWTHDETVALIDSYRDKWYSLRRGNLRAAHWQEVADLVSRRCRGLPAATPKSSVQCRHKVEKLRKRWRAERQRSLAHNSAAPPASSWIYFRKLDAMENGSAVADQNIDDDVDDDEDDDDPRATRSLHGLMSNGVGGGGMRFAVPKAIRSKMIGAPPGVSYRPAPASVPIRSIGGSKPAAEEMRRLEKKRRRERMEREEEVGEMRGMVGAIQKLGDCFMRVEQRKMDMAREMEKVRMDMEMKQTEMMLEWQRRFADSVLKEFVGKKKRDSPGEVGSLLGKVRLLSEFWQALFVYQPCPLHTASGGC